ncbi:hypothetical protein [Chromohalobacter japonicus]|uniref:hypothetical protein n=3 Tax=Chromohalobacter japonicus TaxID=223900 RepID=UPI001FF1D9FF|nr:hypothetical protein [Chromohalobacter japonicus]MCK0751808.1 hypothetical protein [Chromohalobacter japonicus]
MANISFDANYYYEQKLNELQSTDSEQYADWTVADVALSFNENGLTPEEHYAKYGVGEGLNPSAEFDTQAYLSAKLGLLQEQDSEQYADWTVEDVAQAFEDNGLSPLEHFNQYGQDEGLEAVPAAASALTEALETLQTAESNLADFLEAGEYEDTDAVDAELTTEQGELDTHIATPGVADYNEDTLNVLKAKLQDAQDTLAENNAAADEVEGLSTAISALKTAEDANVAAVEAQGDADTAAEAEIAKFQVANGDLTLTEDLDNTLPAEYDADVPADNILVSDGAGQDLIEVNEDGDLVISEGAEDYDGIDALLTSVQDYSNAIAAANTTNTNLTSALEEAVELTADVQADLEAAAEAQSDDVAGFEADVSGLIAGDGSIDFSQSVTFTAVDSDGNVVQDDADTDATTDATVETVVTDIFDAEATIETIEGIVEEREELIADRDAAQEVVDQKDAFVEARDEAEANLTDDEADGGFGVNLVDLGGTGTAEDDLFIFSAGDDTSTDQFGAAGEDQIYVGDSFTRVDLAADADFTEEQGDVSTMEVFFQQDGADAVLTFEDKAFAGNGSSASEDLTEVTLTGVNVDDLSLDSGYVSVA